MKLRDRLRVLFTGRLPIDVFVDQAYERVKQVAGGTVVSPGVARWPEDGYANWAREAYGKNELVYACITEIATSVPEAPLRIYRDTAAGWEEVPDHPLRQLIRRPNPVLSEYELWELTVVHLYLAGNAYWEIVRSRDGRPKELWPLRPDRVRIIPDPDPRIHHTYAYAVDGQLYPLGTDVLHFKFPNPLDEYFGQPPLRAAVRAVAVDNEATAYVQSLLQNDAMPRVIVTTQQKLDEDTVERLRSRWRERYGRENRGMPAFLQAGMDVKVLGLNLKDLEFPDLRATSESRICAAFGVPPVLVGAKVGLDRSTFANYSEARRSFWEETISPLLRRLADRINHKLLPMFRDSEGLEARFDTSEVSALQESVNEKWRRITEAVEAGWLMVDEARAEAGYDPFPDGRGRVLLRPTSVAEVPVGGGGEDGGGGGEPGDDEAPARRPRPTPGGDEGGLGEPGDTPGAEPSTPTEDGPPPGGDGEPGKQRSGPRRILKSREAIAESRNRLADRYERRWREWAREEFQAEARDTLRAFWLATTGRRFKALADDELMEFLTTLEQMGISWRQRIQDGSAELIYEQLVDAAGEAGSELDVAFQLNNDFAKRFVERYVFIFAQALSRASQDRIREIILAGQRDGLTINEMKRRLLEEFDDWTAARAERVARTETLRASNAGAMMAYQQAGVQVVEWLPAGDACPYCKALKGRRWAVGSALFQVGDEWHPEGVERPYRITYEPVQHPPLHPHCRCTIVPVVD
ncbi:phage portal protein, HK97 family [Thermaerobacter marianensis DSM 12885]|uniref:Phage portal protein, HK97 family n=1 Tax=Thermaerobacter marianensis (strain ATCC 700841 / DSM 12885 / JCM 10246 / 7p75a) TaxID=644966 RepID=E6SKH5_THEM7|nr:phage portal protein [Thermaerobacter marianensis]ADU50162.1 phage portal protein, HK97 family [Thermaerobacter marianensis DSM 12885]